MEIELYLYNVLVRWGHILVGIAWIGLLYYFNFVQTEYVKVADPDAKACLLYTSPSPRDKRQSRMPSSA